MNFKQNQRNRYQFFSILFQLALASNNNALRFFNKKKKKYGILQLMKNSGRNLRDKTQILSIMFRLVVAEP